ncbi:hypothetical protein LSTR_LSTR006032 [Laodelphax striatellus]|uniref:Uncharacterized protein n=1 Tax=Laodelphax striatellus TaxID=195883 RepID=A0A482XQQ6_LAOST|nr:hypothetical protein LSTR_LSTR006032 [Laodelphax striatellus]
MVKKKNVHSLRKQKSCATRQQTPTAHVQKHGSADSVLREALRKKYSVVCCYAARLVNNNSVVCLCGLSPANIWLEKASHK